MHKHWNLRVYLLIASNDGTSLLVANEKIQDHWYKKLPGGSVEFGEGIAHAAHREATEELGEAVALHAPYFFTESYLPSLFRKDDQVVALYYRANLSKETAIPQVGRFAARDGSEQYFEWIPKNLINPQEFKLASDETVLHRWLAEA
jgi:8-oxo-dGTP diphosphatase